MVTRWSSTEGDVVLHIGDCLAVLPSLPDRSIDAICTDPPYGLEFMGREWDTFKPSAARIRTRADARTNPAEGKSVTSAPEAYIAGHPFQSWCQAWASECLRVLKPGGHLLAFGGTRTWHRLTCAIGDAGFEIRDSIHWIYGSGFPKSANVTRAIDRAMAPGEADPPPSGEGTPWNGWGTALKPAHEPIVVARKPLEGTVAANVLQYGTGALNIDGCRIAMSDADREIVDRRSGADDGIRDGIYHDGVGSRASGARFKTADAGRWPSNILLTHSAACEMTGTRTVRSDGHHPAARGPGGISTNGHGGQDGLDERKSASEEVETWSCSSDCPVAELDRQSGVLTSGANPERWGSDKFRDAYGDFAGQPECVAHRGADAGGASRFYPVFRYEAKAPASERPRLEDGTAHPTVKPLELVRFLVRLITPPSGTVLDLFAGSGTTAEACIIEGFRCVLIEQDPAHAELIKARLAKPIQPDLFGGAA